ncbi:peptide ABC transporter [Variovorax sp. KBW07]|uniref:ABC transporter permease n=1 Tax=Variovorax sp. KBW07 TaxID=2153358 RepID=UPI000F55F325|nr:ABC transporter permease [Variovorax sp. KBW07]RQO54563.1 peptide ABC transporter [Variovorax sp. KBW07]
MLNFIVRRALSTIPVFAVVGVIVFLMLRLMPGDPAAAIVGEGGTTADIARIRAQLGLDDSLLTQMALWFNRLLHLDFGESYFQKQAIGTLIAQRIEPTLSLAAVTIVIAVVVSVPLGVLAAWRHGGWLDRALMSLSVVGFSVPVFVVGYVAIWFFGLQLQWVPTQGYSRLADGVGPWLLRLVLPACTLSIVYIALIARVTRAAVAEALAEDHVRTARAKGLSEGRVLVRHALSNAAVPIVTVIGLGVASLIGGVVVTETVFAIPGLGALTVDAVLARDYPLVQGLTLSFSVVYVLINLLVDLSYLLFDPRIRY